VHACARERERPLVSEETRDDLRPDEHDLVGQLLDVGSRIEADAVSDRIAWLARERLVRVAGTADGGDVLFRDPRDGRLWELTHPHAAMPRGGPPRLTLVDGGAAARKYGDAARAALPSSASPPR
jgi:hypothetical protein